MVVREGDRKWVAFSLTRAGRSLALGPAGVAPWAWAAMYSVQLWPGLLPT
jgi:hypothetical protein